MADTDKDWRIWGDTDPYYGVAAAPEFRRDNVDIGLFLETGEAYLKARLPMLERQLGPVARHRALDFGCGVGRITIPLAVYFEDVTGLDVSPGMLKEARALSLSRGICNINFLNSDDHLSEVEGRFDFVHSYIVFQHIPTSRGLRLIAALLDRVAIDGLVSIHFSVDRGETFPRALLYWARTQLPGVQDLVHRLRGKKVTEPMMQMNEYPPAKILRMLHRYGFGRTIVDFEQHGRFMTMHVAAKRDAERAMV
ncbi:MAG: methyltransferase domain-containing protein [Sphingobium limneticum]